MLATPASTAAANPFAPAPAATGGYGGFGSAQVLSAGAAGASGGLFGGGGGGGLFGGGAAAGGLFGAPAIAPVAPLASSSQPPPQQPQPPTDIFPLFRAQMLSAWDPANARACAFRHVFLDDAGSESASGQLIAPSSDELARLRSANRAAADDLLWDRVDGANSESARLVPVQVTGFHALQARADAQRVEQGVQACKLRELSATVDELADSRDVGMRVKLDAYRARHVQVWCCARTLALAVGLRVHARARTRLRSGS
jgi:hypothetical protein